GTFLCFFFFSSRRRHTRFSRDWSSDVCSSDLNEQVSWPLALMASAFLGALAGGVTATLNLRFKIMDLLSGILVMMALYSINLRLISGPNLTLDKSITATLIEPHLLGLLGLAMMVLTLGILFFQTQMGLALR